MDAFTRGNPVLIADPAYMEACAAALRAVASQLTTAKTSDRIRAIATELENINDQPHPQPPADDICAC